MPLCICDVDLDLTCCCRQEQLDGLFRRLHRYKYDASMQSCQMMIVKQCVYSPPQQHSRSSSSDANECFVFCSPRPDREKNMYPCELPDHVVVALLKREALFHRARLHTAQIRSLVAKERLRTVRTKQCQVSV